VDSSYRENRVFLHQVLILFLFIVGFTRNSAQKKHIMIAAALSAIASHSGTITSVLYRRTIMKGAVMLIRG
jgi:hypothetical protein